MLTLVPRLSTQFHHDLASQQWLRSLTAHLVTSIAAHDEYQTSDGDGVVYSDYNEERYMGPLSVVKYDFRVEVNVGRSSPTEDQASYQVEVKYCPDTKSAGPFPPQIVVSDCADCGERIIFRDDGHDCSNYNSVYCNACQPRGELCRHCLDSEFSNRG